jgi:hypothetical protein
VLDQPLPPAQPVKGRGAAIRAEQARKLWIGLHFLKIVVISDRNHC